MFSRAVLSWPLLAWSGLTAFVLSTWFLMLMRQLGVTRYLPRAYWSCAITGGVSDAALLLAGLVRAGAMIIIFPMLYAVLFARFADADLVSGAALGLAHGFLAGFALPLAARRCGGAHPPGLLGWRLGRATPLVILFVHAAYGALLGYVYVIPTP